MNIKRRYAAIPAALLLAGCAGLSATAGDSPATGSAGGAHAVPAHDEHTQAPGTPGTPPGTVAIIQGTPVDNLVETAAPPEKSNYCAASRLPPGEGLANKGNTCVSTPLGEIAAHPVRVTAVPRHFFNLTGQVVKVKILVEDNQGVLDLNAFTHDANNKAGVTLHEHGGQLDAAGRPLLHCHLGVASTAFIGALPGETYDAAFSGVQGFKGDLTASITGLPRGTYRGDVYCSVPGHPQLPTALANQVQAFDTFDFRGVGRNR